MLSELVTPSPEREEVVHICLEAAKTRVESLVGLSSVFRDQNNLTYQMAQLLNDEGFIQET